MRLTLRISPDVETLNRDAADAVIRVLESALALRSRATIFLAGGSTPEPIYERLGGHFRDRLPWDRILVFWGDERWVAPDDPRSNQRNARKAWIEKLPIPDENVHPMPTDGAPEDAAQRYDRLLKEQFSEPGSGPDLLLLGLGPEGHTASLFPESPALQAGSRWVLAVRAEAEPPLRLTVTPPFINRAKQTFFLVSGKKKAAIVRRILLEEPAAEQCPAAGVRPSDGELTWWLDAAAAARLPRFFRPPRESA